MAEESKLDRSHPLVESAVSLAGGEESLAALLRHAKSLPAEQIEDINRRLQHPEWQASAVRDLREHRDGRPIPRTRDNRPVPPSLNSLNLAPKAERESELAGMLARASADRGTRRREGALPAAHGTGLQI